MRLFGVIGAGGFGREVMPLAAAALRPGGGHDAGDVLAFVVEDAYFTPGQALNGYRVIALSDFLAAPAAERRYTIAIGDSVVRERIAQSIPTEQAVPFPVISPSTVMFDGNAIGDGAIFCSFTHVTSNATIGRFFHANIYSYVAHDCVIGDYVTFGPGVMCNGRVTVEDHVYVGAGAIIRDGTDRPIIIGRGARIGMGAVVTKSVAPGETVVGNPARPLVRQS